MNLRPTTFNDIIGQEDAIKQLKIIVESAKARNCAMPHILYDGPPGTGKTTMSVAIANERSVDIQIANGGNLNTVKSILPYIIKISQNSVLFIDEIHRLPTKVEEMLYTVLEDFRLDLGQDDSMNIDIPKFTMIGATTEAGSLAPPMFDRFVYKITLKLYNHKELSQIIMASAKKLGLSIYPDAALNLAKRSRGTPRIANNLITWIRDYCFSKGSKTVSNALVDEGVGLLKIDPNGVTEQDRAYLRALKRAKAPMGLRAISDTINVDEATVRETIEPFLMRNQLIQRTPRGRILCES